MCVYNYVICLCMDSIKQEFSCVCVCVCMCVCVFRFECVGWKEQRTRLVLILICKGNLVTTIT